MRVGIDLTYANRQEGTGTYIRSLLGALARLPDIEIVTFTRPRLAFLRHFPRPLARALNGLLSVLWLQIAVPIGARRQRLDLFHAPAFIAPLFLPCPLVLTIHDAAPFTVGQQGYPLWGLYLCAFVDLGTRRASRIIAVSTHAAGELARVFGLPAEKVRAIPHGVASSFRPLPPGTATQPALPGVDEPFILFVGASDPRKNYTTLLAALRLLHERGDIPPLLVVTGSPTAEFRSLAEEAHANGMARVNFVGYVTEETLVALYNRARAFVFPSRYEGFGLPVLEAMACGCPVICANTTSLPEVAGDAALLIDPDDRDALADALAAVLHDRDLAARLTAAGIARARQFTWEETATRTLAIYREVCYIPRT